MRFAALWFTALLSVPAVASAQAPLSAHVSYAAYAAGLHVADLDVAIGLGPSSYRITMSYHTTGLTGVFMSGHQDDAVSGNWSGSIPRPTRFTGLGHWRGEDRVARIDYDHGTPVVRDLTPPDNVEREPVPMALQQNSIDVVSGLAQLVRTVEQTGHCDGTIRTYDGRRAVEIGATTAAAETLDPSSRSIFSGKALRCNFSGRLVAGFKFDDDRTVAARPLTGSAWFAPLRAGETPLPVRIVFQTRWMGDMTMYLTDFGDGATSDGARRDQ